MERRNGTAHHLYLGSGLVKGIGPILAKKLLPDRTEALVCILAHERRHMHQQHAYAVHSGFPVGRGQNARAAIRKFAQAYAIHKLRAVRRKIYCSTAAAGGAAPILGVVAATTLAAS